MFLEYKTSRAKSFIMGSTREGGLTIMREKLHNLIDTIQEERLLRKIYFYILGLKGGRK
jgi:hypothetical protein